MVIAKFRSEAMYAAQERERQRVAHLVLGQPRPKPKTHARRSKRKPPAVVLLAPGIEERVALREAWSHKAAGTPETHEHHAIHALREGALARLHLSGAIDAHQLAASQDIALAHARTVAEVAVRTAQWEKRFSSGRSGDGAIEGIGAALLDRDYTAWRAAVAPHAAMLLAIIVDDMALTAAARHFRLSNRRARTLLIAALDRWVNRRR